MQKYAKRHFHIENSPAVEIYFNIIAKTPAEVVEIANIGFAPLRMKASLFVDNFFGINGLVIITAREVSCCKK